MPRHFKVEEVVKDERELEDLRVFARQPARTYDEIHQWLLERGYTIGRTAVGNWKQSLDGEVMEERFRNSGSFAANVVKVAQESGAVGISDAALLQLTQVLFEQTAKLDAEGAVKSGDLLNLSMALKTAVGTKQGIEKLREEYAAKQKTAIAAAEQAAKSGDSATAVVDVIRKSFGL